MRSGTACAVGSTGRGLGRHVLRRLRHGATRCGVHGRPGGTGDGGRPRRPRRRGRRPPGFPARRAPLRARIRRARIRRLRFGCLGFGRFGLGFPLAPRALALRLRRVFRRCVLAAVLAARRLVVGALGGGRRRGVVGFGVLTGGRRLLVVRLAAPGAAFAGLRGLIDRLGVRSWGSGLGAFGRLLRGGGRPSGPAPLRLRLFGFRRFSRVRRRGRRRQLGSRGGRVALVEDVGSEIALHGYRRHILEGRGGETVGGRRPAFQREPVSWAGGFALPAARPFSRRSLVLHSAFRFDFATPPAMPHRLTHAASLNRS